MTQTPKLQVKGIKFQNPYPLPKGSIIQCLLQKWRKRIKKKKNLTKSTVKAGENKEKETLPRELSLVREHSLTQGRDRGPSQCLQRYFRNTTDK